MQTLFRYKCIFLLIITIVYFGSASAKAESCGDIVIPADYYYPGSEEERRPITDCANPFGSTESLHNFQIEGQIIVDGAVIYREEAVTNYGLDGYEFFDENLQMSFYKHEGNQKTLLDLEYSDPTRDEYERVINQIFPDNQDRVNFYVDIFASDNPYQFFYTESGERALDPYTNEGVMLVYYSITDQVYSSVVRLRTPLDFGTYTAVWYVSDGSGGGGVGMGFGINWWSKFIQTAHASEVITRTITFTIAEPQTPTGASSVLFLPGIQASLLEDDNDQLWTPTRNQDVKQLAMDSDGNSINDVYTTGIMSSIPFGGTVYDSFGRYMVNLVHEGVIAGWIPFAYDWRYSVEDVAKNGTKYKEVIRDIIDEIDYLATNSFSGKVIIIGHSNGGLLAKTVLKRLEAEGKTNLIDKVILMASPQLGTPKAIGTILHGLDQEKLGGWIIDDITARDVIQNMPGAYGLVPSEKFLNFSPDKIIRFDGSSSTELFRNSYGETIDSIEELKQFMSGSSDGRSQAITIDQALNANETLLSDQLTLHKGVLDDWHAPTGTQVIEIVGTGLDTISGFEYRGFSERVCTLLVICQTEHFYKPVPVISQKGDKTVIALSAEGYSGDKEKYFVDLEASDIKGDDYKVEHYNISEHPSVQRLVGNIITATTSEIEFISTISISNNDNRVMFGVHSPVEIELTDTAGRRVGKKTVAGIVTKEELIPRSSYFEIGTSKYIIVSRDDRYEIKVTGIGEGGLTFTEDELTGGVQIAKHAVSIATITASTTVKLTFAADLSNLEIDRNGDGNIDQVLTPLGVDVTPVITYTDLKNKVNALSLSPARKLPLQLLVNVAIQMDKKSVIDSKFKQLELLALNQLESLLINYQKKKWVSQTDLEELRFIINKLKLL